MIKLELEELLEKGFKALGSELFDRIYGEDIEALAKLVDDIDDSGEIRRELTKTISDLHPRPEFAANGIQVAFGGMSREQLMTSFEYYPFFIRVSGAVNGAYVEYHVNPTLKLPEYRQKADGLITEGKIGEQMIMVREDGNRAPLVSLAINFLIDKPNIVEVSFDDWLGDYFKSRAMSVPDQRLRVEKLRRLDGQVFSPNAVYEAVISFFAQK